MVDVNTLVTEVNKLNEEEKTTFLVEFISNQNVLALSKMVKSLQDKFGVSAMPVMAAGGGSAPAAEAPKVEQKTTFDVFLKSVPPADKKLNVIKIVRTITNLGLKEAKDLVEAASKPIKQDVPKEEADKIKKDVETVGGEIEIK